MPKIDEDRPLVDGADDEYGFAPIAEKLADSIARLSLSEGVVFGIEGPWGSGKTSFLNFLRASIQKNGDAHVLSLAPWLIGDSRSLVASLVESIAPVLEKAEEEAGDQWNKHKDRAVKSADLVRAYASRTGRGIAPLAKLAGLVVPGASFAGDLLEAASDTLDKFDLKSSDEELKAQITERILALDVRFVVMIDDLDRLEPSQAVEVMRLIRSVADFPRVAYVVCYDREVLAHALEQGLSVQDGDLYLQKIVQLTFALPMPEPFDLRNSLRRKCLTLFREVNGSDPNPEVRSDLMQAIDREGGKLRTPRDVKLVLNGLVFTYPTVAKDVHFPDLVRVHLLRALHPKLHRWIERYLGARSVLVSGDAQVNKADRARLGAELEVLLPDEEADSTNSIWSLRRYIPGVRTDNQPQNRVFQNTTEREVSDMIANRAVGSPLHHRYYFALSAPKAMLSPEQMVEVRRLASDDEQGLRNMLEGFISDERPFGQSWYEHLLVRLDQTELEVFSPKELTGMLMGFATTYDHAQRRLEERRPFSVSLSNKIEYLTAAMLRRLREEDAAAMPGFLDRLYRNGDLSWLVGHFHRQQMWDNGLVGDRPKPDDERILTAEEVEHCGEILRARVLAEGEKVSAVADFGSFIWGWKEVAGADAVKKWLAEHAGSPRQFLQFVMALRGWIMSDRVYHPLRRNAVEVFLDYDEMMARLEEIKRGEDSELIRMVEEIDASLLQGRHD
ncbi:Phage T7 exclusion protein [Hyphomicrobium sulfonivorans]|uniref:Phage T7 exclusion protein n=1 Tax=Hyphomicrobium sulfonivorans TaxID=121290 RepID=A0A120CUU3_HYPSL|nr:KAP family NTPase [Hyphomicrobium sulfonivorans]KWT66762.1 Phage T7 exclusion protein [Hyphomicrobium sulfonivorans]